MRARRIALPALVEREGMPTTEPGDLRWIVAMLNWAWSMVRKDPLNDLATREREGAPLARRRRFRYPFP